jgi:hypothetical protein
VLSRWYFTLSTLIYGQSVCIIIQDMNLVATVWICSFDWAQKMMGKSLENQRLGKLGRRHVENASVLDQLCRWEAEELAPDRVQLAAR